MLFERSEIVTFFLAPGCKLVEIAVVKVDPLHVVEVEVPRFGFRGEEDAVHSRQHIRLLGKQLVATRRRLEIRARERRCLLAGHVGRPEVLRGDDERNDRRVSEIADLRRLGEAGSVEGGPLMGRRELEVHLGERLRLDVRLFDRVDVVNISEDSSKILRVDRREGNARSDPRVAKSGHRRAPARLGQRPARRALPKAHIAIELAVAQGRVDIVKVGHKGVLDLGSELGERVRHRAEYGADGGCRVVLNSRHHPRHGFRIHLVERVEDHRRVLESHEQRPAPGRNARARHFAQKVDTVRPRAVLTHALEGHSSHRHRTL